jgi:hypothetical protein
MAQTKARKRFISVPSYTRRVKDKIVFVSSHIRSTPYTSRGASKA